MYTKRKLGPTEIFFQKLREAIADDDDYFEEFFAVSLEFGRRVQSSLLLNVVTENNGDSIGIDEFNPAKYCLLYHVMIGSGTTEEDPKASLSFLDFKDNQLSVARFLHNIAQAHFPDYERFQNQNPAPELLRVIMEDKT